MRNTKRIYETCNKFAALWQEYFPDWRFMQVICNFCSWLGSDGFYLEEDRFIEKFEDFCKSVSDKGE